MPQPVGAARRPPLLQSAAMWLLLSMLMAGDVQQFPGAKVLPHDKYIHVVSEADSPVEKVYIKSKDGLYVAAAMRKPKGNGPFPVLVHFHGAPGGRGMEQLAGWARGDFGSPVFERFLQEGPFNDILNWEYHRLPDLLGGGWGFEVHTEGDLDKALNAALANRDRFSLLNIHLDATDISPALSRLAKTLSKRI